MLYQLSHASDLGLFTRDFRAVNSRNAKNLAFGEINAISGGQPNHVIAVAKRSFSAVIFRLKQCINGDRHPARCWPDDALGGSAAHRSGKGGSKIRATLAEPICGCQLQRKKNDDHGVSERAVLIGVSPPVPAKNASPDRKFWALAGALSDAILPNFDQRPVGQLKATSLELARPITQPY